jgi:hypothetical protein
MDAIALEETKTTYFGVGATVKEVEQATFNVRTEGKVTGEGFIFSPEELPSDKRVLFQVSLVGTGTVYIKIVESNANGKFIKEHTSPLILLTSNWKEYNLSVPLSKATAQLDILVITDRAQQTEFHFRDPRLIQ